MKCISIRQPWAWLITRPDIEGAAAREAARLAHSIKPVENRTWETFYRGPVAIHASQGMTRAEYDAVVSFLLTSDQLQHIIDVLPEPEALPRGGIVGKGQLVACTRAHGSPYFFGPFGHVLESVEPVPFQPCKGALGYFKLPQGVHV